MFGETFFLSESSSVLVLLSHPPSPYSPDGSGTPSPGEVWSGRPDGDTDVSLDDRGGVDVQRGPTDKVTGPC